MRNGNRATLVYSNGTIVLRFLGKCHFSSSAGNTNPIRTVIIICQGRVRVGFPPTCFVTTGNRYPFRVAPTEQVFPLAAILPLHRGGIDLIFIGNQGVDKNSIYSVLTRSGRDHRRTILQNRRCISFRSFCIIRRDFVRRAVEDCRLDSRHFQGAFIVQFLSECIKRCTLHHHQQCQRRRKHSL